MVHKKNLLISINYLWLSLLFILLIFRFCLRLAQQKGLKKLCSRGFIALYWSVPELTTTNFGFLLNTCPFGSQATFAQDYRKHSQLIDEKMRPQHR